MKETVNHPDYYNTGNIEVIDFIEDQQLGFNLGNAVKYISRAGKKNPEKTVEDLKKARWYLNRKISNLEQQPKPEPEARDEWTEEDEKRRKEVCNCPKCDECKIASWNNGKGMACGVFRYHHPAEARRLIAEMEAEHGTV
jgi:hypothetical protein